MTIGLFLAVLGLFFGISETQQRALQKTYDTFNEDNRARYGGCSFYLYTTSLAGRPYTFYVSFGAKGRDGVVQRNPAYTAGYHPKRCKIIRNRIEFERNRKS